MGIKPVPISRKARQPDQEGAIRWEDLVSGNTANDCSWAWANPEDLRDALVAATEDGAALLLSKTSDGGALVVQVWSGAQRFKLYPASAEEVAIVLMHIKSLAGASQRA